MNILNFHNPIDAVKGGEMQDTYLYKQNLSLNNLQRLICHKTQTTVEFTFQYF